MFSHIYYEAKMGCDSPLPLGVSILQKGWHCRSSGWPPCLVPSSINTRLFFIIRYNDAVYQENSEIFSLFPVAFLLFVVPFLYKEGERAQKAGSEEMKNSPSSKTGVVLELRSPKYWLRECKSEWPTCQRKTLFCFGKYDSAL